MVGDADGQLCALRCLLDSGAQMSTITESFHQQCLADVDTWDVSSYIRISGAQGLAVPYTAYIEVSLRVIGRTFNSLGFLVVKDPIGSPIAQWKQAVPGVIGSNVFRDMRRVTTIAFLTK